LCSLVVLPPETLALSPACRDWDVFLELLEQQKRAVRVQAGGRPYFVAAERADWIKKLWSEVQADGGSALPRLQVEEEPPNAEDILKKMLQGWLQILGPATSVAMAGRLGVDAGEVWKQMLRLESTGMILRGSFERAPRQEAIRDV